MEINRTRRSKIDLHVDTALVEQLTELLQPYGKQGWHKIIDLHEVLRGGDTQSDMPIDTLHWEKLQPADQELMKGFLGKLIPLFEIYYALSPARKKKISEQLNINLHGGRRK